MTMLERAELEGLQKGRQEGRQKGWAKRNEELTLNLLRAGLSKEIICEAAGLSVDELEALLARVDH